MLTGALAHEGAVGPHDLLGAWNLDPLIVGSLAIAVLLYVRGDRGDGAGRRHRWAFFGGLGAVAVALVSPLDAVSGALASAHMVQHVLLFLVAAPLLALSAPGAALLRGSPLAVRSAVRRLRRGAHVDAAGLRRTRNPVGRWVLYVATLWLWHASVLYGAAVEHEVVHVVEHVTFLGSGFLVWSAIVGPVRARVSRGFAVVGVFALALQSTFLSALLTFAREPWYEPYLDSTQAWGLDPLTDQHLAGVLMWIPAGLVHVGVGLALLVSWLREIDRGSAGDDAVPAAPAGVAAPS